MVAKRDPEATRRASLQPPQRLQKVLAAEGLGSRRQIEAWMRAGRVQVNGETATLGMRVGADDEISLDGRPVRRQRRAERVRVLLYNKPVGEICTRDDPEGRRTVYERLPKLNRGRWLSIGRLDINTSGLLLFTNHGELVNALGHPSRGIDREYAVRVDGEADEQALDQLRAGIEIDGETAAFTDVRYFGGEGRNRWYHVCLMEGRNREVRRLFEAVGLNVARLKRVRYGPVVMPRGVDRGDLVELSGAEVRALVGLAGLKVARTGPERPLRRRFKDDVLLPYPGLLWPPKTVVRPPPKD